MPLFSFPVSAPSFQSTAPTPTDVDTWHQSAKDDYQLCRRFADKFDAQLGRSHFSPRVGWDRDGHGVY